MEKPSDLRSRLLEKMAASLRDTPPDVKPDQKTRQEEVDYETERKREEVRSFAQDIDARRTYALCFFSLSCAWIVIITTILLLQGFGSLWFGRFPFKLSEPVLLAVIGTTTVNVLGILYVVANYLFPKR